MENHANSFWHVNEVQPTSSYIANSSHPALVYDLFIFSHVKHFNFPTPHKLHFHSQIILSQCEQVSVVYNLTITTSPVYFVPWGGSGVITISASEQFTAISSRKHNISQKMISNG